jgi:deuterolysin
MISKILPIVALAAAATAACPLSVEISGATDHVAQVAITNIGSETVTVFKGNTVLSDHPTKDLLVADEGTTRIPHRSSHRQMPYD